MTQRLYVSRPIDDRDAAEICDIVIRARKDFRSPRFEVIDPTSIPDGGQRENYKGLVDSQLNLMKTCDAILIDMSLPNHTYIGCIAELVYAHTYRLCTVVYVGSNRIGHRPWLRFHADHIDTTWEGAVRWIHTRLQS
jgi:hypothetical protein